LYDYGKYLLDDGDQQWQSMVLAACMVQQMKVQENLFTHGTHVLYIERYDRLS